MHTHIFFFEFTQTGTDEARINFIYPAKQFESHNELFVDSKQNWSHKGIWIV